MYAMISNKLSTLLQSLKGKKELAAILDINRKEVDGITRSALWDKNDYTDHMRYVQLINRSDKGVKKALTEDWITHLDYLYNDHRTHKLEPYKFPHKNFESFGVTKNHNKTTIYGCVRHAEIITEESIERFYWMASGTSVAQTPLVIDTKLNSENIRVSLKDSGFLFANQNVVMEHGVFPTAIQNAIIKEFGAFDKPSALDVNQTCEWHNIIKHANEYHDHRQNQTYYTGTHGLEIRPSNKA